MSKTISVVIATYNRAQSLAIVLDGLVQQDCNWDAVREIAVIDNNSSDHTAKVIQSFDGRLRGKLRYILETRQGKSYALNTGIEKTSGDILAFTDDDVTVDKHWISEILAFFNDRVVDVLGGRVLPVYPDGTPSWIKDNQYYLRGPIVSYDLGEGVMDHKDGKVSPFIGANVAYARSVFSRVGMFNTEIGPGQGTNGEDIEMFQRVAAAGAKIFYDGKMLVWHKVERSRMSFRYLAQWNFLNGRFTGIDEASRQALPLWGGVPRYLIKGTVFKTFKVLLTIFWPKYFLKHWCAFFFSLGMIAGYRDRVR